EAPQALRAPGILDAADPHARQGQAVDESRRAPAHLDVADCDVLGRLSPDVGGVRAASPPAAAVVYGPSAARAIVGGAGRDPLGGDPPQDVWRGRDSRRAGGEDRQQAPGDGARGDHPSSSMKPAISSTCTPDTAISGV